jgi:hypothetical protein
MTEILRQASRRVTQMSPISAADAGEKALFDEKKRRETRSPEYSASADRKQVSHP